MKLLLFIGFYALLTFSYTYIEPIMTNFFVNCLANLLLGFIAFIFIKLSGMKVDYGFRNKKSYFIGVSIAIILALFFDVIPALLEPSLVGSHTDFVLSSFICQLFYYILIIGPVEELIFRVYIQDTVVSPLRRLAEPLPRLWDSTGRSAAGIRTQRVSMMNEVSSLYKIYRRGK